MSKENKLLKSLEEQIISLTDEALNTWKFSVPLWMRLASVDLNTEQVLKRTYDGD